MGRRTVTRGPRPSYTKKAKTGFAIVGIGLGIILLFAAVVFLSALFYGWLIMLAFGILHSIWVSVPAIGYWPCVALGAIFGLLTSNFTVRGRS